MSEADSSSNQTAVQIRMPDAFLDDVDATWEELGYTNRSEFIRAVLRDAVKHPEFDRADLKAMLAGEVDIQKGRTHSSDEVKAEYGLDGEGESMAEG